MTQPNWSEIRKEFESTNITMKDLAKRHGVKPSTLRSRKNREGWERNATPQRNATRDEPKLVIDNDELTDQQKLFCLYYVQHFNATKAYKQANPGVTMDTANSHGYRMLSNVVVKKEIKRLKAELQQDVHINTKDLLNELARQVKADIKDFVEFGQELAENPETGETYLKSYLRFKDMDEVDGTLIDEIKLGREGVSLKLPNKQKALETLLKYMGDSTPAGGDIVIIDEWDTDD